MLPDLDTLIILSPGFPENEADTTCLPLQQQLIKSIKRLYPDMQVLVLSFQYPFHQQVYNWNGVRVKAFGGKSRGHVFKWRNQTRIWRALQTIQQTCRVTGILSFWLGECAYIGERFAKRYQLKHYCWILGQDAKPDNSYVKRINMSGNSLIALSDFIARSMHSNHGLMPGQTIPGGIEPSAFGTTFPERDIDILGVGSLIPLKQHHLFIEIVSTLCLQFPGIKTAICGNGPEKESLMAVIKQKDLQDHVTLLGELPHPEVLQLMQSAKILLHTSAYEGLGMVCLEALYAGARVVSFTKPFNDAITNWHVAANTTQAINTISSLLNNKGMNYQSVIPFHADDMARNMVALYREISLMVERNRPAMALKDSVEL